MHASPFPLSTLAGQETVTMANKCEETNQLWGVESHRGADAVSVYPAMEGVLLVKTIKEQSEHSRGSINTQKLSLGHDIVA